MLGAACSPCCNCPKCTVGKLPDAVTVTIDGKIPGDPTLTYSPSHVGAVVKYSWGNNPPPPLGVSDALLAVEAADSEPPCTESASGPITAVTLTNPGARYAWSRARRKQPEPTLVVVSVVAGVSYGSGAVLSPTLVQTTDSSGLPAWYISSVTVVNEGSGYSANTYGVYTWVEVWNEGKKVYTITNVVVSSRTENLGYIASVTPGTYLFWSTDAENSDTFTADVWAEITQSAPSDGSGAEISLTVDSTPSSPTFGQITSATLTSGGSGYVGRTCSYKFPEQPKAGLGRILRAKVKSNFGTGASLRITEPGGFPPSEDENDCPSDAGPISSGGTVISLLDPLPAGEKPNGTDGIVITGAGSGYAKLNRIKPSVRAWINPAYDGEEFQCGSATVNLTIEEGSDGGLPFWYVSAVSVDNDCLLFGTEMGFFWAFEPGTVVVEHPFIWRYPQSGPINEDGSGTAIAKHDLIIGGYFYKLDTENVITADVEVELEQKPPSEGSGCTIKPIVQNDPSKPGFGSILKYKVESAGDGYLAWYYYYPCDCEPKSYVLPRAGNSCVYSLCICEGNPGDSLITLAATSCTGSGATGAATKPVGIPGQGNEGPITEVTGGGGSGYAVYGRAEPVVNKFSGGSGAELEIETTLSSGKGNCDLPVWGVSSVSVTKGGYNYTVGDTLSLASDGGTDEESGTAKITATKNAKPELEVQPAGGLTFGWTVVSNGDAPETWGIGKVSLSGDPGGWLDEQGVGVNPGERVTTFRGADLRIRTRREEPTLDVIVNSEGSGASLSASLTKFTGTDKRDQWKIASLSGGGGAGYSKGDGIEFVLTSDQSHEVKSASASVSGIDEDGGITATTVSNPGAYWRDTGEAEIVEVRDGGSYAITGIVTALEVVTPGKYYREDTSLDAIVPPITVTVSQRPPSNGSGAKISAVVNTDTSAPWFEFGTITKFVIDDGGSGYLAASTLTENCLSVEYKGPTQPPTFSRTSERCTYSMSADENVTDCGKFSWTRKAPSCGGMTITVEPGGTVTTPDGKAPCCGCCCVPDSDPEADPPSNPVTLRPSACEDAYGTYIANKACADTDCPTTVNCCVPPVLIGVADAEACEDIGGKVVPKNAAPESCDPINPCACDNGVSVDWSQCPNGNTGTLAFGVGQNSNAVQNGVLVFETLTGIVPGGSACGFIYSFLTRNSTKVDFSLHCHPVWFCNGDRFMYAFLNCETGEFEVHDPTEFFDVHDAFTIGNDGILRLTDLGNAGGNCSLGVLHAP